MNKKLKLQHALSTYLHVVDDSVVALGVAAEEWALSYFEEAGCRQEIIRVSKKTSIDSQSRLHAHF